MLAWLFEHIVTLLVVVAVPAVVGLKFHAIHNDVKENKLEKYMAALPEPNFGWARIYDQTVRGLLN